MQFRFEVKDDREKKVYAVDYFDGRLKIAEHSEVVMPESRLGLIVVSRNKLREILDISDSEYEERIL